MVTKFKKAIFPWLVKYSHPQVVTMFKKAIFRWLVNCTSPPFLGAGGVFSSLDRRTRVLLAPSVSLPKYMASRQGSNGWGVGSSRSSVANSLPRSVVTTKFLISLDFLGFVQVAIQKSLHLHNLWTADGLDRCQPCKPKDLLLQTGPLINRGSGNM